MQNVTVLFAYMSNICGNTDGCAEQYQCMNVLYSLSMLSHVYNIIIDRGVGASGYGREVVDGLNATEMFFFQC